MRSELLLLTYGDIRLDVLYTPQEDTVWLTLDQMSELFDTDRSVLEKLIDGMLRDGELNRETCVKQIGDGSEDVSQAPWRYRFDVVLSVGYRVRSPGGIRFRKWANASLKDGILKGRAVREDGMQQLDEAIRLVRQTQLDGDAREVLSVIEHYSTALDLLDDYDHQTMRRPKGTQGACVLTYPECRRVIERMRFGRESDLFGKEKDDSFRGSIGNIYQSFAGRELYPSREEKAANLLYFVVKNHSFLDGNKRIAAAMFLYFLDRNDMLFDARGMKKLDDHTLVALTIMIAESRPEEKEMMISVIMNCIG